MTTVDALTQLPRFRVEDARRRAHRTRAEWLIYVAEGVMTPDDIIVNAGMREGRPLRAIKLMTLLSAQPGVGQAHARFDVETMLDALSLPRDLAPKVTIGWLLDRRDGGRRFIAWRHLYHPPHEPPWANFPFTNRSPATELRAAN